MNYLKQEIQENNLCRSIGLFIMLFGDSVASLTELVCFKQLKV